MYKSIKGYEGIYEVNELGQVKSVDRIVERKGKELKLKMNKGGYAIVVLNKNGIPKTCGVHRLVAEAFLPNPNNLPQVHHKNHDTNDNRIQNLAWVTIAEQRDDHWRMAQGTRLRVVGHGIDKIFISAREVQRELGVSNSNALLVAKGIRKKANGYKIYFADQETETNNA